MKINYFYTLSEEEKKFMAKELNELIIKLSQLTGLKFYLIYGTLLGAIREKKFIEHDYDVDIAYISKYNLEIDVCQESNELCELLNNKGIWIRQRGETGGKYHITSLSNKNWFDLWISWINNNRYYLIPTISGNIKENIVLPLKSYSFYDYKFLIPQQSEILLDSLYRNWKIPSYEKNLKPCNPIKLQFKRKWK
jgi:hypothetical protein